jgi:hypothetical protein
VDGSGRPLAEVKFPVFPALDASAEEKRPKNEEEGLFAALFQEHFHAVEMCLFQTTREQIKEGGGGEEEKMTKYCTTTPWSSLKLQEEEELPNIFP